MKNLKTLILALIGLVAIAASIAIAQPVLVYVTALDPNTDATQVVVGGVPSSTSKYARPGAFSAVHTYTAYPGTVTGQSYTFGNYESRKVFYGTGTITALTLTMPPYPSDGTEVCVFSQPNITTLTLSANAGQTMGTSGTTISAQAMVCEIYKKSSATWYRSR